MPGAKIITLIAALATNRVIGCKGKMPWHLPAELQHFKASTMGKPIVMGRKTWESIGRPLPGRQNIVVSRTANLRASGCDWVGSLDQALNIAQGPEVMVIGGGQLYQHALPLASRMLLTLVECSPEGDTWFPEWSAEDWVVISCREVSPDERNPVGYKVKELTRAGNGQVLPVGHSAEMLQR